MFSPLGRVLQRGLHAYRHAHCASAPLACRCLAVGLSSEPSWLLWCAGEAGAIGQTLYLEGARLHPCSLVNVRLNSFVGCCSAERCGFGGTGLGCFLDKESAECFGLDATDWDPPASAAASAGAGPAGDAKGEEKQKSEDAAAAAADYRVLCHFTVGPVPKASASSADGELAAACSVAWRLLIFACSCSVWRAVCELCLREAPV